MPTLKEYFEKDFDVLTTVKKFKIQDKHTGEINLEIVGQLHFDFESRALFVSIYIPKTDNVSCPSLVALRYLDVILDLKNPLITGAKYPADTRLMTSHELNFTGRIYIYDENGVSPENRESIFQQSKLLGHDVILRDNEYSAERSALARPLAFISHDSRDKVNIAKPIADGLRDLTCSIWYDEYSLSVGDSLRESIEKGLKECRKCILILSKNFIENEGWGKREFNSIFTREILEKKNIVLPIWYQVSEKDIYEYSPSLVDRYGLDWDKHGKQEIVSRLYTKIKS